MEPLRNFLLYEFGEGVLLIMLSQANEVVRTSNTEVCNRTPHGMSLQECSIKCHVVEVADLLKRAPFRIWEG
jgi:hypothetical protein